MKIEIKGNDGRYVVSNEANIVQQKFDKDGNETDEYVVHITTDTIDDNEDRIIIDKTLEKYN